MGQILTRSDTSATDNLIFARIENSFTPQQIAQASLNPSSAYLTTPRSTRSTRSLANSDLFVGSGVISALAGMALDVEDYFSSLRYLPASLSGSVITGELGQSRRCRQGRSSGRKEAKGAGGGGAESQPLLNGILEAISKRTIDPTGWGSTESWERDIVLAQLQYLDSAKDYCSSILKADFECLDYRAVMERPGAVHATLDFLRSALRTNPTSSTSSILRKPVSSADSANLPSPNAPPHSLLFHRLSHYASPRFEHLKLPSVRSRPYFFICAYSQSSTHRSPALLLSSPPSSAVRSRLLVDSLRSAIFPPTFQSLRKGRKQQRRLPATRPTRHSSLLLSRSMQRTTEIRKLRTPRQIGERFLHARDKVWVAV